MKRKNRIWLSQANANLAANKPIIFWDTCALVDIIRIPHSTKNFTIQDLQKYEDIALWLEGGLIQSVTSDLVNIEFDEHYAREYSNLLQEQEKRKDSIKNFSQYIINRVKKNKINTTIDTLNIQNRFGILTQRICRQTTLIREENIHARFADYRTRHKMAPAANKGEYKDCYIWGTYLSTIKAVNPSVYCAFITTNPKDYGKQGAIDSLIQNDCNSVSPNAHITFFIGQLHAELRRIVAP